jgi:hypothetical protein
MGKSEQWLQLSEISKALGVTPAAIKRLAKTQDLPLRTITPKAIPGCLLSELLTWLKAHPERDAKIFNLDKQKS